jgi:hypothetical protein
MLVLGRTVVVPLSLAVLLVASGAIGLAVCSLPRRWYEQIIRR